MGYPEADEERTILRRFRETDPYETLAPVVTGSAVQQATSPCRRVFVHELLETYIVAIARASRESEDFALGVSPRGTMALYRASQALAAVRGRDYVLPDDIQYLAPFTLVHRLIPSAQTRLRGRPVRALFEELVAQVPVPVEERWSIQ